MLTLFITDDQSFEDLVGVEIDSQLLSEIAQLAQEESARVVAVRGGDAYDDMQQKQHEQSQFFGAWLMRPHHHHIQKSVKVGNTVQEGEGEDGVSTMQMEAEFMENEDADCVGMGLASFRWIIAGCMKG